jgi:antibiotic biosynthesis monooxygenase (ABM) superfamily enzyme
MTDEPAPDRGSGSGEAVTSVITHVVRNGRKGEYEEWLRPTTRAAAR